MLKERQRERQNGRSPSLPLGTIRSSKRQLWPTASNGPHVPSFEKDPLAIQFCRKQRRCSTPPSDPDKIVENVSTPHDDPHPRDPPIVPCAYLNARYSLDTLIIRTLPKRRDAKRRDPEPPGRARAGNPFRAKFRGATGMHRVGSSLDPGRAARPRAPMVVKTGGNMA
jgi:hypothetical protein